MEALREWRHWLEGALYTFLGFNQPQEPGVHKTGKKTDELCSLPSVL